MRIGVLGAGSWGLTLAWLWAHSPSLDGEADVWVWDRNPDRIAALRNNRHVTHPLALELPDSVTMVEDLAEGLPDTDVIVLSVTAGGTRDVCTQLATLGVSQQTLILNTSKGIEVPSLKRLSEVIREELPQHTQAVLSGPTLAKEILQGLPAAASIACEDLEQATYLQHHLSRGTVLRLYANADVTGVELGGALKNIFAIPSGYAAQKGLGDNARAALLTRGLSEMTRFCVHLGAQEMTLFGLSGLGDLLATSHSPLSRNYQVGYRLAEGQSLEAIQKDLNVVAEGIKTTQAVKAMAEDMGLDMPVVQSVYSCLFESPSEVLLIQSLMSRRLTTEQTCVPPQH